MTRVNLILMTLGAFVFTQIKAQELVWPQFRGPNCSGHANGEARPPTEFGEDSNLKWKMAIPEGVSSPVIWNDHLYLTSCIEDNNEMQLLCLNRQTGATIWTRSFFPEKLEGAHSISSPAQSTPVLDNDGIYVYYAAYGVICYDHAGNVRWKTPLNKISHMWGHASSPVIMDDKVILNQDFGGDDARNLIALNKNSGTVSWKTLTQQESYLADAWYLGYSTPVRFKNQIIIHRFGGISSYSIEDGSSIWWLPIGTTGTSTPVIADSLIYIALWNNFSDKEHMGEYFNYVDFSKVIRDFDRDADHLLSMDEVPEDFYVASRIEVVEYEGSTHTIRNWFGDMDKDKNQEVDSLEWNEMYDFFEKYVLDLGLVALDADHQGEISPDEIVWMQTEIIPEVPSPVSVNGFIYTVKDGGRVTCTDAATGKLFYSEKLGTTGGYFASPVVANGYLYIAGHRGIVHVIKASKTPEIIFETKLEGKILATPAIVANTIYVRTTDYLYAFGE